MPQRIRLGRMVSAVLLLFVIAITSTQTSVLAQSNSVEWDDPIVLVELPGVANDPVIVADSAGIVTAFWSGAERMSGGALSPYAIYCSQLLDGRWTMPLDVIVIEHEGTPFPEVDVDSRNQIHMIWTDASEIYYSSVDSDDACSARAWSEPIIVSGDLAFEGDIRVSEDGRVHVVYTSRNTNVFYTFLEDGVWSMPALVSSTPAGTGTTQPRVAVSEDNTIHVVWETGTLPTGEPGVGLFYSRSTDGLLWIADVPIAGGDFGDPGVVVDGSNVYLAWNGRAGTGGRYVQWSNDGGTSWSEVIEVIPAELGAAAGQTGRPAMAVDSAGTLHLTSGLNFGTTGATVHTQFTEEGWTDVATISGDIDGPIEEAEIAITNGNDLHVIFKLRGYQIGYVRGQSNAPYIEPVSPPQATPSPEPTETPEPVTAADNTSPVFDTQKPMSASAQFDTLSVSLLFLPPLVVTVAVVLVWYFQHMSRR